MRNISGKEKSWGFMKQGGRWGRLVLLVLGVSSAPNGKDFLTLALGWEHRAYVKFNIDRQNFVKIFFNSILLLKVYHTFN